jgi:hypothetical protein
VLVARELWELHQQSLARDAAALALCAVNMLPIIDLAGLFENVDETEILKLREEIEPVAFSMIEQAVAERDTSILKTIDAMIYQLEEKEKYNGVTAPEVVAQLYRDAIALCRETLPPDNLYLNQHVERFARYLEKTGRQAIDEGRVSDAEPVLLEAREVLQLRSQALPRGVPYAVTQGLLGESLLRISRYPEAEPLLLESFEVLDTRNARMLVIELYESWGKPDQAEHFREDLLVESVREVGPIWTPEVRGMCRSYSGQFEGRSVWVFRARNGRWAWTDDQVASDGIRLYEPPYPVGGRRELLSLNDDEKAYNEEHRTIDQTEWYLTPGPVIADPDRGRALIVYGKFLEVPDGRDKRAGFSLAVWEHPDSAVVRPIVSPESEEPTLLFREVDPHLDAGALVDGGFLYIYAADYVSCAVARASMGDVFDPDAWRFYAGDGEWTMDATRAVGVLPGAIPIVSVHRNEHLKKYLAVYGLPGRPRIHVRTADRPEGPWSPPRQIFEGPPGHYGGDGGLIARPEFSREGGRIEYMTYCRPIGGFEGELRLIEVTFR